MKNEWINMTLVFIAFILVLIWITISGNKKDPVVWYSDAIALADMDAIE